MQVTINTNSKWLADINNQTYIFTVNHITKDPENRYIYGIRLNTTNYFFSKTPELNDCTQLDNHTPISPGMLKELCEIITEIELKYKRRPALEHINREIFRSLAQRRNTDRNN
jgi:hypothetical protein